MLNKILIASAALALAAPAGGAMAQGYYGYGGHDHARDHQDHDTIHDEVDDAHAEAHEEGFYSRREHKAYHRALRGVHDEFHDEHPNTRHDGYRLPSRRGNGYYGTQGYGSPYGYDRYGPSVTYSYERRW